MSFRPYRDLMSRDFFVLAPEWTVERTLDLLYRLDPEYVLFPLPQGDRMFYIGLSDEIEIRLDRASDDARVQDLPDLLAEEPAPIRDAWEDADDPPDLCLVVEEDELVGVFDVYRGDSTLRGPGDYVDRFLTAEYPHAVSLGQTISVLVTLEVDPLRDEHSLLDPLEMGSTVDLVLRTKEGFEIEGPQDGRLWVEPRDVEPKAFQFRIRATELGLGHVEILAFHQGNQVGRVVVSPRVEAADPTRSESLGAEPAHNVRQAQMQWSGLSGPDLTLVILEEKSRERRFVSYRLLPQGRVDQPPQKFGPLELTDDLESQIQEILNDCAAGEDFQDSRTTLRWLQQRGLYLYENLLPSRLRNLLRALGEDVQSVQILSDEHAIPWELLYLPPAEDFRNENEPPKRFFATRFAMSRWYIGGPRRSKIRLDRIGVLAPQATDLSQREVINLQSLTGASRHIEQLPSEYNELLDMLNTQPYQVLHFSGHGEGSTKSGDRAAIKLDSLRMLRPLDIRPAARAFQEGQPLVFFNACNTGHEGRALSGRGGWARRFIEAGSTAFVGTLWEVRDRSANLFSKALYDHLLDDKPIGEAARLARLKTWDKHRDKTSWLAYAVYADPLAKVASVEVSSEQEDPAHPTAAEFPDRRTSAP